MNGWMEVSMKTKARLLFSFLLIPLAWSAAPAQAKPEQLAQQSAESWLAHTDAGKYADSWAQAAATFKAAVTPEQWVGAMNTVRTPLGKLVSRRLKSATYTQRLPGAPDGEYLVLEFDATFEHKQAAVETVTPMLEKDGKWRVSGYFIR